MTDAHKHGTGGVTYRSVGDDYFQARTLRRSAGRWSLWALGVGAVISGDFFGWNFGLGAGGFGGLLLAFLVATVMYVGLCSSIAEMTAALPHAGGAYAFARAALGPWVGLLAGLSQTMAYVLIPAVIVIGIGGYLGAIFESPDAFAPLWWLGIYLVFVGLNCWGAAAACRLAIAFTLLALAILVVFFVGAIPHVSWDLALDIAPAEGNSRFLPQGVMGIAYALPFALWFYLAIEILPLAAEETHAPATDMPRALMIGLPTLMVSGLLVLVLNSSIEPGAAAVAQVPDPLALGVKTVFGDGIGADGLALIAVAGLIASFHAILFAAGRNIFALSRAGYLPTWLSLCYRLWQTPQRALIAGAAVGYGAALLIYVAEPYVGDLPLGAVLLDMAVFGVLLSYLLQCLSFILLRRTRPGMARPFVSPLGLPGAGIALIIALAALLVLIRTPGFQIALIGCAAWYLAGLMYFALRGRTALVRAPEEAAVEQAGTEPDEAMVESPQ